jgi:hypothetical protein
MFPWKYLYAAARLCAHGNLSYPHLIASKQSYIQYGLLVVQKMYGSKKVLPGFLLEPVYDYFLHE